MIGCTHTCLVGHYNGSEWSFAVYDSLNRRFIFARRQHTISRHTMKSNILGLLGLALSAYHMHRAHKKLNHPYEAVLCSRHEVRNDTVYCTEVMPEYAEIRDQIEETIPCEKHYHVHDRDHIVCLCTYFTRFRIIHVDDCPHVVCDVYEINNGVATCNRIDNGDRLPHWGTLAPMTCHAYKISVDRQRIRCYDPTLYDTYESATSCETWNNVDVCRTPKILKCEYPNHQYQNIPPVTS
jgi:hypothetical protein